ncbi:MAG: hypothetical protein H6R13_1983 [Proteobacteria bacterium]|nr:hypothetical protein [Pseudomonadota bacterium]
MTRPPPSPEELRKAADELLHFSNELRTKFDEAKKQYLHLEKSNSRNRFFSRSPEDFWRMPGWLWKPIIMIMTLLFLLALYKAGQ